MTQQSEDYGVLTAAAVLAIAGVGLLFGFYGPIFLRPESSQRPLLGIFITGPLGALLGAALGIVAAARRMPRHVFNKALVILTIATAVLTLFVCVPRRH